MKSGAVLGKLQANLLEWDIRLELHICQRKLDWGMQIHISKYQTMGVVCNKSVPDNLFFGMAFDKNRFQLGEVSNSVCGG